MIVILLALIANGILSIDGIVSVQVYACSDRRRRMTVGLYIWLGCKISVNSFDSHVVFTVFMIIIGHMVVFIANVFFRLTRLCVLVPVRRRMIERERRDTGEWPLDYIYDSGAKERSMVLIHMWCWQSLQYRSHIGVWSTSAGGKDNRCDIIIHCLAIIALNHEMCISGIDSCYFWDLFWHLKLVTLPRKTSG